MMNLLFIISTHILLSDAAALSNWSGIKLHLIKKKADISTLENAQTQHCAIPK